MIQPKQEYIFQELYKKHLATKFDINFKIFNFLKFLILIFFDLR